MPDLDLKGVPADQQDAALFATATLHALAREETLGRRTPRLLEPGLATWQQFRGRMDVQNLLLVEDGAVTRPVAFDARAILARAESNFGRLSAEHAQP